MGVGATAATAATAAGTGAAAGGIGWGGAAALGGGLLSGIGQIFGGSQASSAAQKAADAQLQMFAQTQANLAPYNAVGQTAATNALNLATGSPTGGGPDYISQAGANMPGMMTQAQLQQTPGYQFNLAQGLKATQSAAAARGLGVSGASLKGAATYATGLADSTYQNQFANAQSRFTDYLNLNTGQQTNLQNQFTRLNALSSLGENAAATTGQQGTYAASNYGNYNTQAGTLTGSGTIGATNALSSGVNNYLGYQAYQQALNPTAGGPTSGYGSSAAGTPGISASGNPVMTGFAPSYASGSVLPGGLVAQ